MRSSRILHLIPLLWSGAGDYFTRLCELHRDRNDVSIFTDCVSSGERDWPTFRRRLARAGVAHERLDFFRRAPEIFWPAVDRLGAFLRRWRPDVVHVHAGVPACAVALALRDLPRRPVVVAQFQNWGLGRPAWMNTMDLWGFRRADLLLVGAEASKRILVHGGVPASRVRTIRLGIDAPDVVDHRPGRRQPTVGFAGRIEHRKAQVDLVRVFQRVRRRVPDAALELIGPVADAEYAATLEQEIERLGLSAAVSRTGYVADVRPFLRRWRVFASASVDEGQGLALVEAMAHGTPVVARRAPGVEDTLGARGRGLLVERRRPAAFADAVVRLLEDDREWIQLSTAGSRWARRAHAWPRCLARIEASYDAACRVAERRP